MVPRMTPEWRNLATTGGQVEGDGFSRAAGVLPELLKPNHLEACISWFGLQIDELLSPR